MALEVLAVYLLARLVESRVDTECYRHRRPTSQDRIRNSQQEDLLLLLTFLFWFMRMPNNVLFYGATALFDEIHQLYIY